MMHLRDAGNQGWPGSLPGCSGSVIFIYFLHKHYQLLSVCSLLYYRRHLCLVVVFIEIIFALGLICVYMVTLSVSKHTSSQTSEI